MSNYAKIKNFDCANGSGIAVSVFLSGCDAIPKCKGCFNSEIWDKDSGKPVDKNFYKEVEEKLSNPHINHLSILGGDPLAEWNLMATYNLCSIAQKLNKKVWLWTWRKFEDIPDLSKTMDLDEAIEYTNKTGDNNSFYCTAILYNIDVLVDGRFIEEQKDLTLAFRGSNNQRLIDIQKSLKENKVVLYNS